MNHQSDGYNTLKRMEFEYNGYSYVFNLNPEEYSQSEPSKAQATSTKGGAWLDAFGAGIATIDFKGTTGLKQRSGDPQYGFKKFQELRNLIRAKYNDTTPGKAEPHDLIFHNYTDDEHWVVYPRIFRLYRSVARPLLYMYEISLICVRLASTPSQYDRSSAQSLSVYLTRNGVN